MANGQYGEDYENSPAFPRRLIYGGQAKGEINLQIKKCKLLTEEFRSNLPLLGTLLSTL